MRLVTALLVLLSFWVGSLTPVQQAIVQEGGSQCGFCTPGFAVTLAAVYEAHQESKTRPGPEEICQKLAGNLCRCTGYRPIVEAGQHMFDLPVQRLQLSEMMEPLRQLRADPPLLYAATNPAHGVRIDRMAVPRTLDQLMQCRQDLPQARLFAGATDVALWVQKQFRDVKDLIYLGDVAELRAIEAENGLLRIGAAVPLEAAWAALATHWPSVAEMAQRFAGPAVRQAGTLGGNIANGSTVIYGNVTIGAYNTLIIYQEKFLLGNGDTIWANVSAGTSVTATVSSLGF